MRTVLIAALKTVAANGPTLEEFYSKNDIDPEDMSYRGKGENGEAYAVGGDKILKITTSKSEFENAQSILKGNYPDFVTIHDTAEIDRSYYIVMEELEQDQKDEQLFFEVQEMIGTQEVSLSYIGHFDEDDYIEEHGEIDPEILVFYNNLSEIVRDYHRLGIEAPDIQPDNLGRDKKGKLKAFDVDKIGR